MTLTIVISDEEVLLIAGGYPPEPPTFVTLDETSPGCSLNQRFETTDAVVGLIRNEKPILCGGSDGGYRDFCYHLSDLSTPFARLSTPRTNAAGIVINDAFFISGGALSRHGKTTEMVSLDSSTTTPGPDLLQPLSDHCMEPTEFATTVLIIGGFHKDGIYAKLTPQTYYLNTENGIITHGPDLLKPRAGHSCTTTTSGLTIVAGGYCGTGCNFPDVEILKRRGTSWTSGKYLI